MGREDNNSDSYSIESHDSAGQRKHRASDADNGHTSEYDQEDLAAVPVLLVGRESAEGDSIGLSDAQRVDSRLSRNLSRHMSHVSTIFQEIREDNAVALALQQQAGDALELPKHEQDPSEEVNRVAKVASRSCGDEKSFEQDDSLAGQSDDSKAEEEDDQQQEDSPPDGGFWAWTTAFAIMCVNAFSWGGNSAFGVYLNYYIENDYFPGANMEEYVTIGGLLLGLSFMICSLSNTLVQRWNYKLIMLIGTALIFLSFWLASIAKTITQLIMFQGFIMSIGYGLAAGACFLIIPMWFKRNRSVAQGIAASGAGLGGIIFSRPVQQMINNIQPDGIKWALRMQACVCGFMLILSILLMRTCKSLIDPKLGTKEKPVLKEIYSFFLRWDLYSQPPMMSLIIWNMVYGIAYTILLFSFSAYATAVGLTYEQGSNVTTVQSVAQLIGRPILGSISDRVGRINLTMIITVFLSILVLCWWTFIKSYAELLVFGFIAGFTMGINWVNFGPMTADYCGGGSNDSFHAFSMLTFSGGIPLLVAELIGLKLRRPEMEKPFLYCQILVGVAGILSAFILIPMREWKVKKTLKTRLQLAGKNNERLEYLLRPGVGGYITRTVYPITV